MTERRDSSLTNHFTRNDYRIMDLTCSMEYARLIDRSQEEVGDRDRLKRDRMENLTEIIGSEGLGRD